MSTGSRIQTGELNELIGARVAETRRRHRMSQLDLAIGLGSSRSKISHMESGRTTMSVVDLLRLIEEYDLDICDICPAKKRSFGDAVCD